MHKTLVENVRLRPRADGIFEVVWLEDGKQKRRSTKTRDVQVARKVKTQIENDIRADRVPDAPTIEWLVDSYLESKESTVTPHSFKTLIASLRPIKERLGALQAEKLTQRHVDDYAQARMTDTRWSDHPGKRTPSDKRIGPSTVDRDLRMLRAVLRHAHASRHIATEVKFRINVAPARPKDVWLTHEEVLKLLDACEPKMEIVDGRKVYRRRNREHLYLFIIISIASAARKEAVLGLTWDRVHLTEDSALNGDKLVDIFTGKTAGNSYLDFGEGKGNKRRPVMPIGNNSRLLTHLMLMRPTESTRDHYDLDLTENRVITFNGKPVADVKKGLATLCEECGITKTFTPHTLKHTAITWMVQKGISLSTISDLTKTSEKILRAVYSVDCH